MTANIQQLYQQRLAALQATWQQDQRRRSWVAWGRLAALAATVAGPWLLWALHPAVAVLAGLLLLALFLRLVLADVRLQQRMAHQQRLLQINQEELDIDAHRYPPGEDGLRFLPGAHPYATDLDLLGPASLYSWLHRTTSFTGHRQLAAWLLQPADASTIAERQQAVVELAPALDWRQDLQAIGRARPLEADQTERLTTWATQPDELFDHAGWQWLRWALPAVSLGLIAAFATGWLPEGLFYSWLLVLFAISGAISKKAAPAYQLLNRIAPQTDTLAAIAGHAESQRWQSSWLQHTQAPLLQQGGAHKHLSALSRILARFDYRYNPLVFVPLNMVLLWDLQQVLALRQWRQQHGPRMTAWLQAIGELEAMSSLANLRHNQPNWSMPTLSDQPSTLQARQLGHPLLPEERRVCSDFSSMGLPQISVITGSNMAGKSTFLRSVGLAIVMAHAGAPVCASYLLLYPSHLMSSMRIADNLEENTSTFYAELKKLRTMIEAVNRREPLFLLLDEILRGTNSHDRQTGSKALLLQLLRQQAAGIIATHDLALADLAAQHPQHMRNYHFDVQVAGEELYFDYQLKDGVCQSLNASLLMKKIGIEL